MILPKMIRTYLSWPTWMAPRPRPPLDLADYPIRTNEKLRFADTDRNGHVSNAVFAVCCQNARMEILHDRTRIPLPIDGQFVIARFELEFLDEMHWPGTVQVGTRLDRIGRSSLTMAQSLFAEHGRVADARSTVVLIDRSTRRPTPFPQETAAALRTLTGKAAANGQGNRVAASAIAGRMRSSISPQPDQQRSETVCL